MDTSTFSSKTMMQYQQAHKLFAPASVNCVAFSQDGALISCGTRNLIRVWRTEDGGEMYNFVAEADIISVLWGDQRVLYCGFASGELLIKVFDEKRQEVRTLGLQASTKPIAHIALDSSETKMALGGGDEITIWSLQESSQGNLRPLPSPDWSFVKKLPSPPVQPWPLQVTSIAWPTGDLSTLVVSYLRHGVVTWNVETSKRLSGISLGLIPQGSLSPDGRYFVVPTDKQTFELYTVGTSMHQRTFIDKDLTMCTPQINSAIFIHHGEWLLGGGTGKATLWHVNTGGQFQSIDMAGAVGPVTGLAARCLFTAARTRLILDIQACESGNESTGQACFQIATVINSQEIVLWKARPLLGRGASETEDPLLGLVAPRKSVGRKYWSKLVNIESYLEWAAILCFVVVGIAYFAHPN